jgi:hypothetical protein
LFIQKKYGCIALQEKVTKYMLKMGVYGGSVEIIAASRTADQVTQPFTLVAVKL